jgi:hypothetical protein
LVLFKHLYLSSTSISIDRAVSFSDVFLPTASEDVSFDTSPLTHVGIHRLLSLHQGRVLKSQCGRRQYIQFFLLRLRHQ